MIRVSDYIVGELSKRGVDTVFLLSGGGMMHLLDAVASHPDMAYVAHHHEQAAAFAADAYARRRCGLGACFATSGPGATNILTGLVGAWQDSSPVVFVTGQSKVSQTIRHSGIPGLRQFGVFEVDIVPIVQSVTKYAVQLDDPQQVRYHVERALVAALSGRPGPVLLDVPLDVQGAPIEPDDLDGYDGTDDEMTTLDGAVADSIGERLRSAARPLIVAGHGVGVAGARDDFVRLVERLNIPVVTTQLAKDLMPYDHPLFVGHSGVKGDRAGNFAVQTADVILTVGASLHVLTTGYELDEFASQAHKIHVDVDPAVLDRQRNQTQEQVLAPVGAIVTALGGRADAIRSTTSEWHDRCARWKKELAVIDEPHLRASGRVDYYDFVHALSGACGDDVTLTTDAGSAFYVIGQAFRPKSGQRVLVSGSLGAMGFALPAATGAAMASPGTPVVCVTGDGSLQTNVHELGTIVHNLLDVKLFVMNNGGYVSIRATQRSYFGGHEAGVDRQTGVALPDLATLAAAYGMPHRVIGPEDDLGREIGEVLAMSGPVLCEVVTSEEQGIIPTVSSSQMPDGSMRSKPIHDMAPFLDEETLEAYTRFD